MSRPRPSKQRRVATLYDAVAGRVTTSGFAKENTINLPSKFRDTASSSSVPLQPDEVLFKAKNAPVRYQETDTYWANEKLSPEKNPNQELPNSDLLKAIHEYASDFYDGAIGAMGKSNRRDWKSMDETALLAMGILLEEATREVLGETGDLVFTEGEEQDGTKRKMVWNGETWVESVLHHGKRKQN